MFRVTISCGAGHLTRMRSKSNVTEHSRHNLLLSPLSADLVDSVDAKVHVSGSEKLNNTSGKHRHRHSSVGVLLPKIDTKGGMQPLPL